MNAKFGGQLRVELIKLKDNTLTRPRSLSTGSQAFSSDSGHEVYVMPPIALNESESKSIAADFLSSIAL
jgi:hypothetical protein